MNTPEKLSDAEIDAAWRSVNITIPYDEFRMLVGRAIEAAAQAPLLERIAELEAELAAAREWLPIESAPKDSTLILLCGKNDRTADGYWQPETPFTGKAHWSWPYVNREPTHWQPRPPPPTQRTEGGDEA